jgi:hypothetical protein
MKAVAWLDRKIRLASSFTSAGVADRDEAEEVWGDLDRAVGDARELRQFGEEIFIRRAKQILIIMTRLRPLLREKPLADLDATEQYLLCQVTKKDNG